MERYDPARVPLPTLGAPVELESVLDEDARRLIDNIAHYLLEPGGSRGPANSYMDTALRGDRRAFLDFLRLLHQRGCLRIVGRRRGRITPFFVKKKGDKQRLVFDCCRVNTCFRDPPYTEIGSAKSFSSISVDPGETVYTATTDIEACFYQCGVTSELSEWFSLAGLSPEEADFVGITVPTELAGGPSLRRFGLCRWAGRGLFGWFSGAISTSFGGPVSTRAALRLEAGRSPIFATGRSRCSTATT